MVDQELFVPMLAKIYDLQESAFYDNLTSEKLEQIRSRGPEPLKLDKKLRYYVYHTNPAHFHQSKEVKMRVLAPYRLNVDFE